MTNPGSSAIEVVPEASCLACQAPVAAFESHGGDLAVNEHRPLGDIRGSDLICAVIEDHEVFW